MSTVTLGLVLAWGLAGPAAAEPGAAPAASAEPAPSEPDEASDSGAAASEPTVAASEPAVETSDEPGDAASDAVASAEPEDEPEPLAGGPAPPAEPIPVPGPAPAAGARVRASATDGFGLDSADGRFGLSLGLLGQVRYSVDRTANDVENGFDLRLLRPMLQGHLWGRLVTFQVVPEFAGNTARLLDANAIIELHPAFSVLVGQFRPWFSRAFPTPLAVQAQLDRGPVLDAFRIDRDMGVTLMGRPFEGRLEYYVGVLDGEGLDRRAPRDPQPLVTGRVVAAPLGAVAYDQTLTGTSDQNLPFRFAVAANGATNEVSRVGTITDPMTGVTTTVGLPRLRTVTLGGDVAIQWWRLMAMGEGFWRSDRFRGGGRDDAWGAYGMLAVNVLRKRLDLVARAGALRLEGETAPHLPVEPGVSLYLAGNHAKLQLRYRCDLGLGDGGCIAQGAHLQGQVWF